MRNYCGEEQLSCNCFDGLHCDIKVNYLKSIWDFLCSKQHRQLLNSKKGYFQNALFWD